MKKTFYTLLFSFLGWNAMAQNNSPTKEFKTKAEKEAWLNSQNQTPEFKTQAEKDAWVNKKQLEKVDPDKVSKIEAAISNEAEKDAYLNKRQNTVYMTQAEFDALPARKQASVLADKNFIITK